MKRFPRACYQLACGLFAVLLLGVSGLFSLLIPNPTQRREFRIRISHHLARLLVARLKIETWIHSPRFLNESGSRLWVANHASLLDAIILLSLKPVVFVTSKDMGEKPGLGFLARSAGCLFVERRNRHEVARDSKMISEMLMTGFDIVVFPEGTSTDGSKVLPFKRGLFRSAIEARTRVQPVCIRYEELEGRKIETEAERKRVYVYGDHSIAMHLIRVFTNTSLKMKISFLEPIPFHEGKSADHLAFIAHEEIEKTFHFGTATREKDRSGRKKLPAENASTAMGFDSP